MGNLSVPPESPGKWAKEKLDTSVGGPGENQVPIPLAYGGEHSWGLSLWHGTDDSLHMLKAGGAR